MTSHVTVANGMSNSSRIAGRAMPTAVVLIPAMACETPTARRNDAPPEAAGRASVGLTMTLGHVLHFCCSAESY